MLNTNGKSASSLLVAVIVGALVIAALPLTAQARIASVFVDTTSWSPRSDTRRTPLFRNGGNVIGVLGTDVGMLLANDSIEIREGFCGVAGFGRLIAVGKITNKTTQIVNNIPTARLTLSIPLTATHPRGNFCGHITYPAGNLSRDTFTVRIYRRGVVTSISAPATAQVMTNVELVFSGSRIGNSGFFDLPLPLKLVSRVTDNDTVFRARVQFTRCGKHELMPQWIHDRSAPAGLMQDWKRHYQGSARRIITVSGCTTSPTTSTLPGANTVSGSSSCGCTGQPACTGTKSTIIYP